jgi:hypothetical protein
MFNKLNVPTFLESNYQYKGLGFSHSKLHNYYGQMHSVISLNIFLYHGWVDSAVEMKIRRSNHEDKVSPNTRPNY